MAYCHSVVYRAIRNFVMWPLPNTTKREQTEHQLASLGFSSELLTRVLEASMLADDG